METQMASKDKAKSDSKNMKQAQLSLKEKRAAKKAKKEGKK